jgi:hypothetical protein
MIPETLIASAVGYLVSSIKNNKTGQQAGEEISTAIWEWVRPIFLKDDEPLTDLQSDPDNPDNQTEVSLKIKKHLKKNPDAQTTLETIVKELKDKGKVPAQTKITQIHHGSGDNIGRDKIING